MPFVQGDYLTFQGGILKIILSNLSNDELKQVQTVSKEWNRTVTNILDSRKIFESTMYSFLPRKECHMKQIKLEPVQFSVVFCQKKVFARLKAQKLTNHHLLNVKELEQVRFISGRYLPPVIVDVSEPFLNYWRKTEVFSTGAVNHSLRSSNAVDISIFQLQYPYDESEVETALREYESDEAVKSIMVFLNPQSKRARLEESQRVEKFFRNIVERVQTEPFTSAGLTVNNDVLLPTELNNCKCKFEATILVFRGKGLKVTSDLFYWDSNDLKDEFNDFIHQLCIKAGPPPKNGKRIVYIFECCAVKRNPPKNWITLITEVMGMDTEIVFARSKYNEFFTSPFNNRPHSEFYDGIIRQYSSIVSIYDFSGVSPIWKDVYMSD